MWWPSQCESGEGRICDEGIVECSRGNHWSTDGGMGVGIGRVNWGPSAAGGLDPQPDGIIHKPLGGRLRRRCGHSKRRSDRTIQPDGEPRATGPAVVVRSSRGRLVARPITDKTPGDEIPTVTAYKPVGTRWRRWPWREVGLKPYWGKPAVRNFRGAEETKWRA